MTLESYFASSESYKRYSNGELCNYIFTYICIYALHAVYVTFLSMLNTHTVTYTHRDACIYTHTPIPQQQHSMSSIKKKKKKANVEKYLFQSKALQIQNIPYGLTHRYMPADKRIQRWINRICSVAIAGLLSTSDLFLSLSGVKSCSRQTREAPIMHHTKLVSLPHVTYTCQHHNFYDSKIAKHMISYLIHDLLWKYYFLNMLQQQEAYWCVFLPCTQLCS